MRQERGRVSPRLTTARMVLIGTASSGLGPALSALEVTAETSLERSTGAGALAKVPGVMGGTGLAFTLADPRPRRGPERPGGHLAAGSWPGLGFQRLQARSRQPQLASD